MRTSALKFQYYARLGTPHLHHINDPFLVLKIVPSIVVAVMGLVRIGIYIDIYI